MESAASAAAEATNLSVASSFVVVVEADTEFVEWPGLVSLFVSGRFRCSVCPRGISGSISRI